MISPRKCFDSNDLFFNVTNHVCCDEKTMIFNRFQHEFWISTGFTSQTSFDLICFWDVPTQKRVVLFYFFRGSMFTNDRWGLN